MKITFIVPTYNNLRYLKNAIRSIRTHAGNEHEIVVLDDASADGTEEWLLQLKDPQMKIWVNRSDKRLGHTITYNLGAHLASSEIISILHADMFIGPNYVENALKHLDPYTVVSATRIEPPLHPSGLEKITKDFGMWPEEFKEQEFLDFVATEQKERKDQTTRGIFAPWFIHRDDFLEIGGHDSLFAPFPYEDSDIFQRFMLAGYGIVQSRDALVYHLTCRGHKWTDPNQLGKVDDSFEKAEAAARKNYLRKWGSWIRNNEYSMPVIFPKYPTTVVIHNTKASPTLLPTIEPLVDLTITDLPSKEVDEYLDEEQKNTVIDMTYRVMGKDVDPLPPLAGVVITIADANKLDLQDVQFLVNHNEIISQMCEEYELSPGVYDIGNLEVRITTENLQDSVPSLRDVPDDRRVYVSDFRSTVHDLSTGLSMEYGAAQ